MAVVSFPKLQKFIVARLSPEGELGLHLTAGVLLLALATWAFGCVADDVRRAGPIVAIDHAVVAWCQAHASTRLTPLVLAWTNLNSLVGTSLMSLLLAVYFRWRRARFWLVTLVVAVPGGMLLNVLLSWSLNARARCSTSPSCV